MDRGASTSTSVKQDDELSMATSQLSLSKSPSLMQQKGSKKKRVQKKPSSPKSKGKQITSNKPKKSESSKRKRTQVNDLYECDEDYYSVKERAGKLLLSLDPYLADVPSFGKRMLPSNVTYSFWMILPVYFCKSYLPQHDTTVILVDECGEEFKMNFLMARHGLSAGWRGFSIGHRLVKGDILLFHLVEPCKLKGMYRSLCGPPLDTYLRLLKQLLARITLAILPPSQMNVRNRSVLILPLSQSDVRNCSQEQYRTFILGHRVHITVHIVRVHSLDMIEAALCLIKIDANEKASTSAKGKKSKKANKETKADKKRIKHLEAAQPMDPCSSQAEVQDDGTEARDVDLYPTTEQSGSSSDSPSSNAFEEGSELTDHVHSNELNGSEKLCYREIHRQEGISCRTAIRRYDSSSTVAT